MPNHSLGFIREWGALQVYRKLYSYLQYVLTHLNIPFIEYATMDECWRSLQSTPETTVQLLLFLPFDALCRLYRDVQRELPQLDCVQYIYIVTEPNHNLESAMDICNRNMDSFYAVLNFNMNQDDLIQKLFPEKPHFHCFQGYIPTEDFPNQVLESERTVDVLAPGFGGSSDDRKAVVAQLRQRGLTVMDETVFHEHLDKAIRTCKVAITYPFNAQYDIWYGQRTLWAINKQTCVVAVPSKDTVAEQFYSDLAVNTTRDQFVDVVVDLVQSGKWKQVGAKAYERYKSKYQCIDVFNLRFYTFCKRWTQNIING